MTKSTPKKQTVCKVVISTPTNRLEILRGYGLLSRKGTFLQVYDDDLRFAVGRLSAANLNQPPSGRLRLVRVVAVVEKLDPKEIRRLLRSIDKLDERETQRLARK